MYIDTPFTESSSVKIIQMNKWYASLKGKTATLSGWGKSETDQYPTYLSQITPMITMDANDHNGMAIIRMANTAGSGVCQGDSGGNIFLNTIYIFSVNIPVQITLNVNEANRLMHPYFIINLKKVREQSKPLVVLQFWLELRHMYSRNADQVLTTERVLTQMILLTMWISTITWTGSRKQ